MAGTSSYAPIVRAVEARVAPSDTARVVGRLTTQTPEGTTTIVPVIRRVERGGTLWIEVGVPVLPNGTTGWVPRSALGGYGFVTARLEISLRTLRAFLYRGSKRVFSAPIGIGKSQWPTPTGRFIIRNKLTKYASPTYGPVAFGINARSAVLTDWPAGGFVGIHGTNRPSLIPGRISHGCIRLRNIDILRLERLMPLGTPVTSGSCRTCAQTARNWSEPGSGAFLEVRSCGDIVTGQTAAPQLGEHPGHTDRIVPRGLTEGSACPVASGEVGGRVA